MSFLNTRIQFHRLRKNGRKPNKWPVDSAGIPLRVTQMFDFKLPEVTPELLEQTNKKESDVVCIQEMMTLFDCFQKHEFDKVQCIQQSMALEKCYQSYIQKVKAIELAKARNRPGRKRNSGALN